MLAGEQAAGKPGTILQGPRSHVSDARRRSVILLSLAAFLFALCCLPTHVGKLIIVPALLVGAGASQRPAEAKLTLAFRQARDLQFLLFAFVWILVSGPVLNMQLSSVTTLLGNIVLLALLWLLVKGIFAAKLQVPSLVLLVCFTVLGALLSIGADLSGGHGFDRLGSVALNGLIIPAAGGYACAVFAVLAVWRTTPMGKAGLTALCLATLVLLAALAWNQSRGPIVALVIALLSVPVVERSNSRFALITACLTAFIATSSAILFEDRIHAVLCADSLHRLCDPSKRLELWGWAIDSIAKHPVFGVGFGTYFSDEHRPHPHNGVLALAYFAGLPFLLAFLGLCAASAIRLPHMVRSPLSLYAAPALVFGCGYMGTDLANAVGFIGTHYLFIWIPIFTAYSGRREATHAYRAVSPDGNIQTP